MCSGRVWYGSLERRMSAQVSSSSSDHGSKLRDSSQNRPRGASERDVNIPKPQLYYAQTKKFYGSKLRGTSKKCPSENLIFLLLSRFMFW
ncbi:hypothetical protein AVEN_109676-1 [Araneus ventricosus]|uniref:Uncharacterized protein n=1 Tax=Araneus ventricosus TaxID=182803 RepID=A0A4Y2V8V3_ARAVE|nr:hypothetical protein AVEN_109676-1 [Araneus ventricosus]